jgi:hypothetical protein
MNPTEATLMIAMMAIGPVIVLGSMYMRYRTRQLQHMERIAAIEKGVTPPPVEEIETGLTGRAPREHLLRGMMWLFSGIALTAALLTISSGQGRPLTAEEKVQRATDARHRGASDHEIEMLLNDPNARTGLGGEMPLGVAFLGLIPVGVGIAYLIYFRMEKKNLVS